MSAQLRLDTLFALQRKRGADEAELDAPLGDMQRFAAPEKRCTHIIDGKGTRCKWWFPEADEHAWCKTCRSKAKKWNDSENATVCKATYRAEHKEQIAEYNDTYRAEHKEQIAESDARYRAEHAEQIKAYSDAWNNSDAGRESKARYRASAAGVAARARERASGKKKLANARYREKHIEEIRRKAREAAATPMGLLCRSLHKMVAGAHWNPQSFPALGSFQSNEEARAHFESFFEASGWMTWRTAARTRRGTSMTRSGTLATGCRARSSTPSTRKTFAAAGTPTTCSRSAPKQTPSTATC